MIYTSDLEIWGKLCHQVTWIFPRVGCSITAVHQEVVDDERNNEKVVEDFANGSQGSKEKSAWEISDSSNFRGSLKEKKTIEYMSALEVIRSWEPSKSYIG